MPLVYPFNISSPSSSSVTTVEFGKSTHSATPSRVFSQIEFLSITAALVIISIIGSLQNLAVIIAVLFSRNRLMSISSTWFVFSLATADLLVCVVSIPVYLVHLHLSFWEPFLVFGQFTTLVSSGSLVLLTFNRFLSIFDTLRYMRRMSLRRALLLAVGMWIVAISLTTLSTIGKILDIPQLLYPAFAYYSVINIFTGSFHLYMFHKARSKMRAIKQQLSSVLPGQQASVMRDYSYFFRLFAVVGTYLITWIPFVIVLTATSDTEERRSRAFQRRFAVCYLLLSINSAIDPLIYFLRSDEFRRFTRRIRPLLLEQTPSANTEQNSAVQGKAFHVSSNVTISQTPVMP